MNILSFGRFSVRYNGRATEKREREKKNSILIGKVTIELRLGKWIQIVWINTCVENLFRKNSFHGCQWTNGNDRAAFPKTTQAQFSWRIDQMIKQFKWPWLNERQNAVFYASKWIVTEKKLVFISVLFWLLYFWCLRNATTSNPTHSIQTFTIEPFRFVWSKEHWPRPRNKSNYILWIGHKTKLNLIKPIKSIKVCKMLRHVIIWHSQRKRFRGGTGWG